MSQSFHQSSTDGFRAPWHYAGTLDAARKMYTHEGIRSFYSGLTAALLGLTHVAIQFPLYEYFKLAFTGYEIGEHPQEGNNSHFISISLATFLSKLCASTITYPHEVLRTRLQTQHRHQPIPTSPSPDGKQTMRPASPDAVPSRPLHHGIIKTFKSIWKEEGWRAFYSGIGTNLFRAVPAAMTTMLTYEYLQMGFQELRYEGSEKLQLLDEASLGSGNV